MMKEPPVWSRQKMLLTAFQISCAVLVAGVFLFAVANIDLELAKQQQKVERMEKYLGLAEVTINEMHRRGVQYTLNDDLTPDEKISSDYADLNGSYGYYQDEGRYLRLDIFHPDGPFKGPLFYWQDDKRWILASRGPNEKIDLIKSEYFDNEQKLFEDSLFQEINATRYDPTNGAGSGGDIIYWGEFQDAD